MFMRNNEIKYKDNMASEDHVYTLYKSIYKASISESLQL